ncbi:type II toxin-antitoxin system VapC family toxin [Prosthecobacter sp. SYSU 5D2]|uniref:type II toxin-antitoxin system VapC family toxin n=1 Tax=Prosthecobacter sp. SYSU 5D2 TaxID=3134134 RepID=UPI0031FEF802
MRLLLDSCAVVWWLNGPELLSDSARTAIASSSNQVFVSAASLWELGLKVAKGKLKMPPGMLQVLEADGIQPLSVTCAHAEASLTLAPVHADPFDRLLIAQALSENMILVTRDEVIPRYLVQVMRA